MVKVAIVQLALSKIFHCLDGLLLVLDRSGVSEHALDDSSQQTCHGNGRKDRLCRDIDRHRERQSEHQRRSRNEAYTHETIKKRLVKASDQRLHGPAMWFACSISADRSRRVLKSISRFIVISVQNMPAQQ